MRVSKWGNSLAIRLPADVVQQLQLEEGDEIQLIASDLQTFTVDRLSSPEELLKEIRMFRGRLKSDFKFDREEANARR